MKMGNERFNVMIDLDGVLADFEGKVTEILGRPMNSVPKNSVWKAVSAYNNQVAPFFESLPKMADADMLVKFCVENFPNVRILTATGYVPKDAAEQKKRWVLKHYGPTMSVKTVTSSEQKAMYANPKTILIDDRSKSIGPWESAGGIGILHRNSNETIAKLKDLINS
jgi:5'(3')-deoxyribonucleotidase